MNILLMPFGSSGDVHPMFGLGLALAARGHRITAAVNGYFWSLAEQLGFELVEFGTRDEFLQLAGHPEIWHPRRAFGHLVRGLGPLVRRQYDFVAERYIPGETLVITNCFGFGARAAQQKLGVPLVSIHLQPSIMWSDYDSPYLPGMIAGPRTPRWFKRLQFRIGEAIVIDRAARPIINGLLAELGLPPMRRTMDWWHSPECVLGLFPAWYAAIQPDWPANVLLAQFPLWDEDTHTAAQPEVEAFLAAGDPPIVFTPGSANSHGAEFFAAAADACRRLGRRGLLLSRFPEQIPADLPAGVRHFDYVPFSRVLPRSAAMVHHGGIGTSAQAMRAGIPQLIMPLSHDQPDNAARLKRLGVADWLLPNRFSGANVAERLDRLLASPDVNRSCAGVAARFLGVDPFAEACQVIERYAASRHIHGNLPAPAGS
jgi:UDP:flavonoid glycosyltransferase YjiC (YdhE family)